MSVLRHLVGGHERRDLSNPWGPYAGGRIPPPGLEGMSTAGPIVTERTSLQILDVYACVSLRADSILMLPARAFREKGGVRDKLNPQPPLIAQPDPEMTAGEFWSGMEISLQLRGNAYAVITSRDAAGWPTATKLLHPDDARPRRNPRSGRIEYQLVNGDVLPKADMIHVKGPTIPGQLEGLNPIECARRGLGATMAAENFGARWFADSAAPSSVLETDQELDDVDAKKTVANWVHTHGGRRRPAVLSGGLKWRPITITPNDSQFLETKHFNTSQIARLFRTPPHMIGELVKTTSWGKGLEEQGIGYAVYSIGPDLVRFEDAFTPQLPRPQYLKFNPAALLRGNVKDRYLAYAIARQWGWVSVNDIRELEDLPPVDGGDVYLQPLNMIDAEAALKVLLDEADPKNAPGGDE